MLQQKSKALSLLQMRLPCCKLLASRYLPIVYLVIHHRGLLALHLALHLAIRLVIHLFLNQLTINITTNPLSIFSFV